MATAKSTIELDLQLDSSSAAKSVQQIETDSKSLLQNLNSVAKSVTSFNKSLAQSASAISDINKSGLLTKQLETAKKNVDTFNKSFDSLSTNIKQVEGELNKMSSSKFLTGDSKKQLNELSKSFNQIKDNVSKIEPLKLQDDSLQSDITNIVKSSTKLSSSIREITKEISSIDTNKTISFDVEVDADLKELKDMLLGDMNADVNFDGLDKLENALKDIKSSFGEELELKVDGTTFQTKVDKILDGIKNEELEIDFSTEGGQRVQTQLERITKAIQEVKSKGGGDIKDFSSTTKKELNEVQKEANDTGGAFSSLGGVLGSLGDSIGEKLGSLGGSGGGGLMGALGGAGGALAITGVGAAVAGAAVAIGAGVSKINEDVSKLEETRKMVFQFTGLTGDALNQAAAEVQSLANAYEVSEEQLTTSMNAIAKNRGISMDAAGDFIGEGLAAGLDEEGLQQLSEYDIQFKKAGLSINDSIRAIRIGTTEGIYDDKFADSIKEFGLRLQEFGTDVEFGKEALAPLGEDFASGLRQQLENGSIDATEAAQQIFERMDEAAISTAERGKIISEFFGGAGEDAGRLGEAYNKLNNPITSLIEDNDDLTKSMEKTFSKIDEQLKSGSDFSEALAPLGDEFAEQFNKGVSEGRDSEKLINDVIEEAVKQGYSAEAAQNIALQMFPPESVANAQKLVGQIAKQAEETNKVTAAKRRQAEAEEEYQQRLAATQLNQQAGLGNALEFAKTKVMTVFLDIYNQIVGETAGGLGEIITEIADNITSVTDPIVEYVGIIVQHVKNMFGLVGDIFSAIGSIIEPIIEIFTTAEDTTKGIKEEGSAVSRIMDIIGSFIQAIVDRLSIVFSILGGIFKVVGVVAKVIGTIVGAIVEWTVKVFRIKEIFTGLTNIISDIKQTIIDTFSDRDNPIIKFFERTYNAVRAIVNKLGGDLETFDELMDSLNKKEEEVADDRKKRAQDSEGENTTIPKAEEDGAAAGAAAAGAAQKAAEEKPVEIEIVADTTKMIDAVEDAKTQIKDILTESAEETIKYEQDLELILNPIDSNTENLIQTQFGNEQEFKKLREEINVSYDVVEERRQSASEKLENDYEKGIDSIVASAKNADDIQKELDDSALSFDNKIVEAFQNYEEASKNASDAEKAQLFSNFEEQRKIILANKELERKEIIDNANFSELKRNELNRLRTQKSIAEAEIERKFIEDNAAAEQLAEEKLAALKRKQQQEEVLQYAQVLQQQQEIAKDMQNEIIESQIEFSKSLTNDLDLGNERDNIDVEFKFDRNKIQEKLDEELKIMQNSLNRFAESIGIDIPVNLSGGEQAQFLQEEVQRLEAQLEEDLPNLTETEARLRQQRIDVLKNMLNQRVAVIENGNREIINSEQEYYDQLNKLRDEEIAEERKKFDEQADMYADRAEKILSIVQENESLVESIINSSDTQALGGVVDGARATLIGLRSFANDMLSMTAMIKRGFDEITNINRNFEDGLQDLEDHKDKLSMIDDELEKTEESISNANGELKKTLQEKQKALLADRKATMEYIKSIEGNRMELEASLQKNQEAIEKQKEILNDPTASKEAKEQAKQNLKDLEEDSKNIESQLKDNMKKLKAALQGDLGALKELIFDGAQAITKAVFSALQKSSQATVESLDKVIGKQQERVDKLREALEEGGEAAKNITAEQLEIEEARLQRSEEQRREELQKQQNFTTAQIALQGAIAVARALATLPPPLSFVVAAATTAALFAQIASVRSRAQGAVQAEHGATVLEGGKIKKRGKNNGGTIDGRRHSSGGVLIEAEAGEDILSRKVTTEFRDILDLMHDGKISRSDILLPEDITKMDIQSLIKNGTFNDNIFSQSTLRTTPIVVQNNFDYTKFDELKSELQSLRLQVSKDSGKKINNYMDGKKVGKIVNKNIHKKNLIKNKASRK